MIVHIDFFFVVILYRIKLYYCRNIIFRIFISYYCLKKIDVGLTNKIYLILYRVCKQPTLKSNG